MRQHSKKAIKDRLARAAGHLNAVSHMLDDPHPDCCAIVHQLGAVRAAIGKAAEAMVEDYLHTCLESPEISKDPKVLGAFVREIFKPAPGRY